MTKLATVDYQFFFFFCKVTVSPPIFSDDLLVVCQLTIFHDVPVSNSSVKTVSGTLKKPVINVLFIIINATLLALVEKDVRQIHDLSTMVSGKMLARKIKFVQHQSPTLTCPLPSL